MRPYHHILVATAVWSKGPYTTQKLGGTQQVGLGLRLIVLIMGAVGILSALPKSTDHTSTRMFTMFRDLSKCPTTILLVKPKPPPTGLVNCVCRCFASHRVHSDSCGAYVQKKLAEFFQLQAPGYVDKPGRAWR